MKEWDQCIEFMESIHIWNSLKISVAMESLESFEESDLCVVQ